jgi:type IV pilus assembly protein PilQ
MAGTALMALASQPAQAAATVINDVDVRATAAGLELRLNTRAGEAPQVFAISQGKTFQVDIANARLALPQGRYEEAAPAPGIASIQLVPLNANSVRLTIQGTAAAPVGDVQKIANQGLVFRLDTRPDAAKGLKPTVLPASLETVPGEPRRLAQAPVDIPTQPPANIPAQQVPDVLVPNPEIIIDGAPVLAPSSNAAPPFLPRAVAPPVGDMSVSDVDAGLDVIDLGTAERVPRLVLRDAPAREVLSLLARAAGLNLAFTDASAEGGGGTGADNATASADVRVTLDIENEPVQNVFNYVLQISGLEANRVGRTIFVGPRLPQTARNVIVRSIRLNQISVENALSFMVAMGAESAIASQQLVTSVNAVPVGDGIPAITETETTTQETVDVLRADYEDAHPMLRGLQVIGDERTNSITLVGTPRQVQIASAQLTQLDVRVRQVAINVRVIDVNLNALDQFSGSFSFGAGDINGTQTGGLGVLNFGNTTPFTGVSTSPTLNTPALLGLPSFFNISSGFLLQLQAVVQNNQAKVITDPTLIVQEGQTASVQLTQQVINNVTTDTVSSPGGIQQTVNVEFAEAGLILQVDVNRIDDNGFVTMSVAPSISAPTASQTVQGEQITLLAERLLSSGQVRVRDGQTLILSGIIQEQDRNTVSKVPILGDIPILGALFRSSNRSTERQELIVLLTPQILDDSDQSVYGYSYTPGEDVQLLLEQQQNR